MKRTQDGGSLMRLQRLSGETATLHLRDGTWSVILASEESVHQLKVTAPAGCLDLSGVSSPAAPAAT